LNRRPAFKVGDLVRVSTAHLLRNVLDSKFSPRFVGPFKIVAHTAPSAYVVDFGEKYPRAHATVSADLLRPCVQPSSCPLRHAEPDYPIVGDSEDKKTPETLVARQRWRGRPPAVGRPIFQYRVRFQNHDPHYDVWLPERELRARYPDSAPSLIQDCDVRQ
jgi:hypothetical protein